MWIYTTTAFVSSGGFEVSILESTPLGRATLGRAGWRRRASISARGQAQGWEERVVRHLFSCFFSPRSSVRSLGWSVCWTRLDCFRRRPLLCTSKLTVYSPTPVCELKFRVGERHGNDLVEQLRYVHSQVRSTRNQSMPRGFLGVYAENICHDGLQVSL